PPRKPMRPPSSPTSRPDSPPCSTCSLPSETSPGLATPTSRAAPICFGRARRSSTLQATEPATLSRDLHADGRGFCGKRRRSAPPNPQALEVTATGWGMSRVVLALVPRVVERHRTVHGGAIVPDHQVALAPLVPVHERALGRVLDQLAQEETPLGDRPVDDAGGVGSHVERAPVRARNGANQRMDGALQGIL